MDIRKWFTSFPGHSCSRARVAQRVLIRVQHPDSMTAEPAGAMVGWVRQRGGMLADLL